MQLISRSEAREFWLRYSRNKTAVLGLAGVVFFVAVAIFSPLVAPYDPLKIAVGETFIPPSHGFPMGTDNLGRDVYSGVIDGTRISLMVGFLAAATSTLIGAIVGAISGFYGGWVDDVLMRITELLQIIPRFILAIVMVAIFGPNTWIIIAVIGLLSWPYIARVTRVEFMSLKEQEFVEALKAVGANDRTIILEEILPNATPSILVNASLQISAAILLEAGLSFMGLGDPNVVSWGTLLNNAQKYLTEGWWIGTFPGLAILIATLAFNMLGDGLNEALNPRLRDVGGR